MSIRLLLVDDQELVRTGFRLLLQTQDDFEVVGEAGDGAAAIERARALRPDVVLMDIRMPGVDGIEATARLIAAGIEPPPRILVLTTFDLDEYVFGALRAGAAGFLLKDTPPRDLAAAVRTVAAGNAMLAPTVTKRLIAAFARKQPAGAQAARNRLAALPESVQGGRDGGRTDRAAASGGGSGGELVEVLGSAVAEEQQVLRVAARGKLAADRLDHQRGQGHRTDAGIALGPGLEATAEPAGLIADRVGVDRALVGGQRLPGGPASRPAIPTSPRPSDQQGDPAATSAPREARSHRPGRPTPAAPAQPWPCSSTGR